MEEFIEDYQKYISSKKTPNSNQEQVNEIFKNLQKKKQCETTATKIVEFLMEGKIEQEVFLRSLKHLNQAYYDDAVEERSLNKICGYAICSNRLQTVPSKSFSIDNKNKKVYNITNRKKFCSNFCYTASEHLKVQLDNSPIWIRDLLTCSQFNLLDKTEQYSRGEVYTQISTWGNDPNFVSVNAFASMSLDEINDDLAEDTVGKSTKSKSKHDSALETLAEENEEIVEEASQYEDNSIEDTCQVSVSNKGVKENPVETIKSVDISTEKPKIEKAKKKSKKESKSKTKSAKDTLDKIKKCFYEWITLETYAFLFGDEKLQASLDAKKLQEYIKTVAKPAESRGNLSSISENVVSKQGVEDTCDIITVNSELRPVPGYSSLKKESRNINVKVRSFYDGTLYDVPEVKEINEAEHSEPSENMSLVLDSDSIKNVRRNIYLTSQNKSLVTVTQNLGLYTEDILRNNVSLVKTFNLEPHNTVFQPAVWNIINLIIVKLLSLRDPDLEECLKSQRSKTYINLVYKYLPNSEKVIEELLNEINNVNVFLEKRISGISICK